MASFTKEFHKQRSRKITDLIKDYAIDLLRAQIQAFARAFLRNVSSSPRQRPRRILIDQRS